MILADLHTGHFHFQALTEDEERADQLLMDAWASHCLDYPEADPNLMADEIRGGWVSYAPVEVGTVLRDGEEIL